MYVADDSWTVDGRLYLLDIDEWEKLRISVAWLPSWR